MQHKRKTILFIIGGVVLLILVKVLLDVPYRSGIPKLPELQTLIIPLQDQLKAASKKAYLNPTADNLGMLGMVYHSSAIYDKAAECYKLAIKKNKSKWIWSYYLGYLNNEMGEPANAIENFNTVIKENPDAFHAWYYIGTGYQNLGANDKAEDAFKKISSYNENARAKHPTTRTDYFPLRIYAKYQLARVYINSGKPDLAESTIKETLKDDRRFGSSYRLLANINSTKGNKQLSDKYINRANDLINCTAPVDTIIDKLALLSKSDLYLLKQIDEAERNIYPEWATKLLTSAIKVMPENKYLISKSVKIFLKIGDTQHIIPFLDQHMKYFKDDRSEIKEVADLLDENGAYAQSLVYYQQAVKLDPEVAELQSNLVMALFNAGMKEKSLDYMNKLLEKDKKNIELLSNGVYIMLKMGENKKADTYLSELMQLAPTKPKVQQLAGMIAERDGKLQQAIDLYEKSFNGDPTDLATIEMLGAILLKQKAWEKSVNLYRKALETHPNEPYLLNKFGALLIGCPDGKLRNIDEGIEYSERALDHKAGSTDIMLSAGTSLAQGYALLGDKRTAAAYLNSVIQLAQSNNAPQEYLADLGRKLKEINQ